MDQILETVTIIHQFDEVNSQCYVELTYVDKR